MTPIEVDSLDKVKCLIKLFFKEDFYETQKLVHVSWA